MELNAPTTADDAHKDTSTIPSAEKNQGKQKDEDEENRRLAESQESQVREQTERQKSREAKAIPEPDSTTKAEVEPTHTTSTTTSATTPGTDSLPTQPNSETDPTSSNSNGSLEACSIWIGSSKETVDPASSQASDLATSSRFEDLNEEQLAERDGIGIVYMPLIPNPVVPDLDPTLISTWRRAMDPEETDKLLTVAKVRPPIVVCLFSSFLALLSSSDIHHISFLSHIYLLTRSVQLNFMEGDEKIRKLLKAMWLRKKKAREEKERRYPHLRIRRFVDQYRDIR
jgi:phospholipase A2